MGDQIGKPALKAVMKPLISQTEEILMATEAVAARSDGAYHGSIGQVCHADQKLLQDRRPGKLYDDFGMLFPAKSGLMLSIWDVICKTSLIKC